MAHLVGCWCGRKYRCDIEHPPKKGVCVIYEIPHEENCPDMLLHGTFRSGPIEFMTISIPYINGVVFKDFITDLWRAS